MLEPRQAQNLARSGSTALARIPTDHIAHLGAQLIGLGAAVVGIKVGDRGFYLATSSEQRLATAGPGLPAARDAWAGRELWSAIFETQVAGTNGAGDATVAGFLFGLLSDMTPEKAITAACAVGAASVEAADATSGVQDWDATGRRITAGWPRRVVRLGALWCPSALPGVWLGPRDGQRC